MSGTDIVAWGSVAAMDRVRSFFDGECFGLAVGALRSYFAPLDRVRGPAFDHLPPISDPDRFTSEDLLGGSMLSVDVPARAALHLLDHPDARDLLREIPSEASLWTQPELLDRDSAAWGLWRLMVTEIGMGMVITSKLLAAKRPALVPVFDQRVAQALGHNDSYWAFWQEVAADPAADSLLSVVSAAMREAEVPPVVTHLRAIDVTVWMTDHAARRGADDVRTPVLTSHRARASA